MGQASFLIHYITGQTPTVTKIKILYVITKSNFGGAQRYVYNLATNLPKEKFDIKVALGGSGLLAQNLEKSKIPIVSIPCLVRDINIFAEILVFFSLLRIFYSERPDVVHLNSSKIGGTGALAGRIYNLLPKGNHLKTENYKLKTKIIFTSHGWAFNESRGRISRAAIWLLQWLTVLLSHKTITVSKSDYRQGSDMPFCKSKIALVYNGISGLRFKARANARRELLGDSALGRKNLWIGTISELHKNKGLIYLLGAIKSLVENNIECKDITCVILGDGEEKEFLTQYIHDNNLEKNIILAGYKEKAYKYLKAFDIFTLTSLKEGLPFVLLEAAHAKLPVIATNVGGIPQIIIDMKTGILIRPKNSSEIAKGIIFMAEDKKRRVQLGSSLNSHAEQNFSFDGMLEGTKTLYNRSA